MEKQMSTANSELSEISNTITNFTTDYFQLPGCNYTWWPQYYTVNTDVTARAMKVVKTLMDKKLVKLQSIQQFTDLVDEIAKLI